MLPHNALVVLVAISLFLDQYVDPTVQLVSFLSSLVIIAVAVVAGVTYYRWWRTNAIRDWWIWSLTFWPKQVEGGIPFEVFECDGYERRPSSDERIPTTTEENESVNNRVKEPNESTLESEDSSMPEDDPTETLKPPPCGGPRTKRVKVSSMSARLMIVNPGLFNMVINDASLTIERLEYDDGIPVEEDEEYSFSAYALIENLPYTDYARWREGYQLDAKRELPPITIKELFRPILVKPRSEKAVELLFCPLNVYEKLDKQLPLGNYRAQLKLEKTDGTNISIAFKFKVVGLYNIRGRNWIAEFDKEPRIQVFDHREIQINGKHQGRRLLSKLRNLLADRNR